MQPNVGRAMFGLFLCSTAWGAAPAAWAAAPPASPVGREETPAAPPAPPVAEPFAYADFSWMPGNAMPADRPLRAGPFTGEFRADTAFHYSFQQPRDDTLSGSSEVFRHGELQLTHLGLGGDFAYKNVQGRVMTQFGLYATTTPRNDASTARGQWQLADAYRYLSEAYGGLHFDVLHGINLQAGIFMSYVGLWSYYNDDNWTYQPSYVSSNTPWYFQGARLQIFVSDRLKIEPWLVNGWQSYGRFNYSPGVGMQVAWRPRPDVALVGNQYFGTDTLSLAERKRLHTDDSVMVKFYQNDATVLSKAAASLTVDAGCEIGGGAECSTQYFLGFMAYARLWFWHDRWAVTAGGGAIRNPGRYLVLLPPINGATAASGTPYFTANLGDPFAAWDTQATVDYTPTPFCTLRLEYNHRAADVPYFSGPGGVTPPGGNTGTPATAVANWSPDLRRSEDRLMAALMLRL